MRQSAKDYLVNWAKDVEENGFSVRVNRGGGDLSSKQILEKMHKLQMDNNFKPKIVCYAEWCKIDEVPSIEKYFFSFNTQDRIPFGVKDSSEGSCITWCVSGVGGSIESAVIEYAFKISDKILVVHPHDKEKRKEFKVPFMGLRYT